VAAPSPGRATGEQAGRGESFEPAFARVRASAHPQHCLVSLARRSSGQCEANHSANGTRTPLAVFDAPQRSDWRWPYRTGLLRPFDVALITPGCGGVKTITVVGEEMTMGRLAKTYRPVEHRLEHGREVAGRGVDDLQNFSQRRLLSFAFITLSGALLKFAPEIGNDLLRSSDVLSGVRLICDLVRPCSPIDHTWIVDRSTGS